MLFPFPRMFSLLKTPVRHAWWSGCLLVMLAVPALATENPAPPALSVDGNRIINAAGETVVLRGVSIADPHKLNNDGQWGEALFDELAGNWHVNHVRIPVHPKWWRERGADQYLDWIDQAVAWARERGLYLIIDWHSIGYLGNDHYTRDIYETSLAETRAFWEQVSSRYAGESTIAVYELYNEPTLDGGRPDEATLAAWSATLESLIDLVRENDPDTIPLVAGFNWAYDLTAFERHPVKREGIAYASHPYPQKVRFDEPTPDEDWFAAWEADWGVMAARHPIIATELGWVAEGGRGAHIPVIDDGRYGPRIVRYMESRGISWTAWCFDPRWSPVLIEDWEFTPSEQGEFFKAQFRQLNAP